MKIPRKYSFFACVVLLILCCLLALAISSPRSYLDQRSPKSQAAASAVQAAIRYSVSTGNLPDSLSEDMIRKEVPKSYRGDIDLRGLIYLPPADRRIDSLTMDTVLVIAPYAEGACVGYLNGCVEFIPAPKNINLNKTEPNK